MSDRQGIEIDYCPKCRGVWLDRGELDKIIERSAAEDAKAAQALPQQAQPYPPQGRYERDYGSGYGGGHHGRGSKHHSFLGRLFD
jgi:Zn-finger nucleic acid-binding protein